MIEQLISGHSLWCLSAIANNGDFVIESDQADLALSIVLLHAFQL